MKLFDVVKLTEDFPHEGLQKGQMGTIVTLFETPEVAYEVEFANEQGETIREVALKALQAWNCVNPLCKALLRKRGKVLLERFTDGWRKVSRTRQRRR